MIQSPAKSKTLLRWFIIVGSTLTPHPPPGRPPPWNPANPILTQRLIGRFLSERILIRLARDKVQVPRGREGKSYADRHIERKVPIYFW